MLRLRYGRWDSCFEYHQTKTPEDANVAYFANGHHQHSVEGQRRELPITVRHPLVAQRPYEGEPVFLRQKPETKGARHMKPHPKPAADVPKWSSLLIEAVNKPGMIMEAYSAFHNYSIGNQILALMQCQLRYVE